MSVPTKHRTKSQKRRRASHFALKKVGLATCAGCQEKVSRHRACPKCGEYKKIR